MKKMESVEIIVATHKKYEMPSGKIYLPLQVGAKLNDKIGYKTDDTGDNISDKNPYFCELTGLYWGWKNLKSDFVGLVHYRRHLGLKKPKGKSISDRLKSVLTEKELKSLIKTEKVDLILPKKRNYYIESLWSHYEHTLHIEPLEETRKIIKKDYPEYLAEFDKLKTRKSAHMFNMLIARKEIYDEYCKWLFDILFKIEKKLVKDSKKFSKFHSRFYGRISELLFDVWLYTKYPGLKQKDGDKIKVKELNVIDIEKVNWFKKGSSFLLAKFTGKKYEKSF
jgi:hypothetical protein